MTSIPLPSWPERLVVDEPAVEAVCAALERRKAQRAFVLMSPSLARKSDVLDQLRAVLGERFGGVFAEIPPHTPQPSVLEAAAAARGSGADLLVSLGGGSVIDATKIVQACLAYDLRDLASLTAWRMSWKTRPRVPMPPHIAIPTTLSGAEFTSFAGARNTETGLKDAFADRGLLPSAIVLDPVLTQHTPDSIWLASGVRAMDHAIEAFCSPKHHRVSDVLVQQGLGQLMASLKRTKDDPADVDARQDSQFGAFFASMGLMSGVPMGISHAIGHVLGSLYDVPHGVTSCVILPAALFFNHEAVADRLEALAPSFGCARGVDVPDALRSFIGALGLPTRLSEVGIGREQFADIVRGTREEKWLETNPRPIATDDDIVRILEMAA